MKTFQNKILNPVLSWMAISVLLSGCDLTSLRSSLSGKSSGSSSSVVTTPPTTDSPTTPTSRHDDWGYGNDGGGYGGGGGYGDGYGYGGSSEFGGHKSKKQSQQKSSYSSGMSDSYPSYPSRPSYPSNSGGDSGYSWSDDDNWPSSGQHKPQKPEKPQKPNPSYPQYPQNPGAGTYGPNPYGQAPYARTGDGAARTSGSRAATVRRPIGESCSGSQGPRGICLAVKYVSYVDGRGDDVESEMDAVRDIEYANQIWRDCGIQFQLEDYQRVQPGEYDLLYRTRNYEELNQIRGTFSEPGKLLVVATGKWDRSGSLGRSWANAWTNLPGERAYGVVLERTVTGYPQILAHELGHYLSLDHQDEIRSLMHPVVARESVELSRRECKEARWAALSYWREMMR